MSRGRFRALVALLLVFEQAFLNFDWYVISMNPNGKFTQLDNLSGAVAHPTLQAIGVLVLLEYLLALISNGRLGRGFAIALVATNTANIAAAAVLFANRDLSAVHGRINNLINIAAAHDVTGINIDSTVNGWLFVAAAGLLSVAALVWAAKPEVWAKSTPRVRPPAAKDDSNTQDDPDTIGLWESQRQKR